MNCLFLQTPLPSFSVCLSHYVSDAGTGLSLALLAVGFLLSAQNSPPITLHPLDPQNSTCRTYG